MREVYKNGLNYFKNVGQCFYTNNNNNKNHNNSGNKTGVMAWQLNMTPQSPKYLEKSASEPNLTDHFTPRFPHNLTKLVHEYVTVDDLQFRRKKRVQDIFDDQQYKSNIVLYDKNSPVTPFSELKTEYNRRFGKSYKLLPREKVHGQLNQTTNELLEALRDGDTIENPTDSTTMFKRGSSTAKLSGEIKLEGDENLLKTVLEPEPNEATDNTVIRTCTLKVHGDIIYIPKFSGRPSQSTSFGRSQSIPEITLRAKIHRLPDDVNSAAVNESNETKGHPKINHIIRPSPSTYLDQYNESQSLQRNKSKRHNTFDAYRYSPNESFSNRRAPDRQKGNINETFVLDDAADDLGSRSKHRSTQLDRPTTQKTSNHFEFFEIPVNDTTESAAPHQESDYSPRVAFVQPSVNTLQHQRPTNESFDTSFFCQPEIRRLKKEMLIRTRPPSPSKSIAATIKNAGDMTMTTEEDDNKIYNEKSRIVTPETGSITPEIKITDDTEDLDDSTDAAIPHMGFLNAAGPKFGRRSQARRKHTSIARETQHPSSTDATSDTDLEPSDMEPSFVILKEPCKQNKWLTPSWYL